jgi:hypothetical protein
MLCDTILQIAGLVRIVHQCGSAVQRSQLAPSILHVEEELSLLAAIIMQGGGWAWYMKVEQCIYAVNNATTA